MSKSETALLLCKKSEVPEGEAIKIDAHGLELAVYNVENMFYVTDDLCTHGPGSLSEGILEGHVIECDFHGGCFDIRNGEVVAPPCMIPLRTYEVVEDPENVVIAPPA